MLTRPALSGLLLAAATACSSAPPEVVTAVDFNQPLPIPPLAESRVEDDGTRVVELPAQEGTTEFSSRLHTETWGFNGR